MEGIIPFFLINLHANVDVDSHDDEIAEDVEGAHAHEHVRVVEGDLFARLHHHQDDDQIGSVKNRALSALVALLLEYLRRIHTFADSWLRCWEGLARYGDLCANSGQMSGAKRLKR